MEPSVTDSFPPPSRSIQYITVSEIQPSPARRWSLEIPDPDRPRRAWISEGDSLLLGASREAGLSFRDPAVSGRHAEVAVRGGKLLLRDVGSRNGTLVAGARVEHAVFDQGGGFVLGHTPVACAPCTDDEDEGLDREVPLDGVIGQSLVMLRLAREVRKVAGLRAPVLIRGETGSGKELVASAIHQLGPRSRQPFVPLNMGALPGELVDAELFGHERGAFTGAVSSRVGAFEAARGGTLFLDEVAELPLLAQSKLLRALEGGEIRSVGASQVRRVDVRVVAASWACLDDRVAARTFREDLYHRLAVLTLRVPALRERRSDIRPLADHFLRQLEGEIGERRLSPGGLSRLMAHGWPGNVRELRNVLLRAAVAAPTRTILAEHVERSIVSARPGRPPGPEPDRKEEARHALALHGGNIRQASISLGIARSTLRAWLQKGSS
jgi:DNA-binding NtrC family response regulator